MYYPRTEEGKKQLKKALAQDHAERVFRTIDRQKFPVESNRRLMDAVIVRLKENMNNDAT